MPTDKPHEATPLVALTRRASCLATLCSSSRTLARLSCSSTCNTARHSAAPQSRGAVQVCVSGSSAHLSLTTWLPASGLQVPKVWITYTGGCIQRQDTSAARCKLLTSASPGRMSAAACKSATVLLCCPKPCNAVQENQPSGGGLSNWIAAPTTSGMRGVHRTWYAAARLCSALTQRGCLGVLCRTSARCRTCKQAAEQNLTAGCLTAACRLLPCRLCAGTPTS